MVGVARRLVKVFGVVLALVTIACTPKPFGERALMHAELLRDQARKGVDLAVAGQLTAEALAELLYPLARAREATQEERERAGAGAGPFSHAMTSPVLRKLEALCIAYADLVDAIDRARREHAGPVPEGVLKPAMQEVERRADMVIHLAPGGAAMGGHDTHSPRRASRASASDAAKRSA